MFCQINKVCLNHKHFRLSRTGKNKRPIKGPHLFKEGVEVDLVTFHDSGCFMRGISVQNEIIPLVFCYKGKTYYRNPVLNGAVFNAETVKLISEYKGTYFTKDGVCPSNAVLDVLDTTLQALQFHHAEPTILKLPRIVDASNRVDWLGVLAMPVWETT